MMGKGADRKTVSGIAGFGLPSFDFMKKNLAAGMRKLGLVRPCVADVLACL